jgi:hypothetical protein
MPAEVLACHNPLCCSSDHSLALNLCVSVIAVSCISAEYATLPVRLQALKHGAECLGGQNSLHVRSKSFWWHNIWVDCGRPRAGIIADIMR